MADSSHFSQEFEPDYEKEGERIEGYKVYLHIYDMVCITVSIRVPDYMSSSTYL